MNIEVTIINNAIENDPAAFVKSVNEDYYYQLKKITDEIAKSRREKPVVLLSGPSGSGKTTTALMIEKLLDESGCETHTLSMDNYFCPLTEEEKRLAALGQMDLESPDRIDKDLLNEQIEAISRCEEVEIPKYDFAESKRKPSNIKLKRSPDEMVIFEGIHALDPNVITVPDSKICKIYVSVRTRVTCGDIVLHPSKVRLMRRMIRDRNFRKRSLRDTMNMFHSVENGENKYIMPYKYRSDYDIDTFMAYELNVYRNTLIDELWKMNDVPELADITQVMESLTPMNKKDVTSDSLICEFIGNSQFKY